MTMYRAGIAFVIIFVASIFFLVYRLSNWASALSKNLNLSDAALISKINDSFGELFIIVGLQIALGLIAILFLILGRRSKISVIYVDKSPTKNTKTSEKEDTQQLTHINSEGSASDWLTAVYQIVTSHQNNKKVLMEKLLWKICDLLEVVQGAIFIVKEEGMKKTLEMAVSYAYYNPENREMVYEFGEGLIGQVAKDGKMLNIATVPDGYITIISGLGKTSPNNLVIMPVKDEEEHTIAVIEMASFKKISGESELFLKDIASLLSKEIVKSEYFI